MMSDERHLSCLVQEVLDHREHEVLVSPSWLATETMLKLDPQRGCEPHIYLAAHLQFRQIARGLLRGRFEGGNDDDAQHPLFPALQKRYPIQRLANEEPQYKILEYLSDSEVAFNVARLRREAAGRLRHADALDAWNNSRPKAAVA